MPSKVNKWCFQLYNSFLRLGGRVYVYFGGLPKTQKTVPMPLRLNFHTRQSQSKPLRDKLSPQKVEYGSTKVEVPDSFSICRNKVFQFFLLYLGWANTRDRARTYLFSSSFEKSLSPAYFVKKGGNFDFFPNFSGKKVGILDGWSADEHCLARYNDVTVSLQLCTYSQILHIT